MTNLESRLGLFISVNSASAIKNIDNFIVKMAKLKTIGKLKMPMFDSKTNAFREFNTDDLQAHLNKAAVVAKRTAHSLTNLKQMTTKGLMGDLGLSQLIPKLKKVNKNLDRATARAQKFDMRMLSLLFAGMALRRAFGGALREIHNSFKKAENSSSALSQATMGLNAAWEFLKFSIFNALNQPGTLAFISRIIEIINWTSDLINKYPALGQAIIAAFGVLATTGAVGMVVGQFALGWKATFGAGGLLATQAQAASKAISKTMTASLDKVGKLFGALAVAWGIKLILEDVADMEFDLLDNVMSSAMVGIGLKMMGFGWALKAGVWTFAILTAIEILLDPAGFGKFIIQVTNLTSKTAELVGGVFRGFLLTLKDIFTGKGFSLDNFDSTVFTKWAKTFHGGMEKEILRLEGKGQLSESLQKAWSRQIEASKGSGGKTQMIQWDDQGRGFFPDDSTKKYNDSLNILSKNLPTANVLLGKMKEAVMSVDEALVTKSLVPSMDLLNKQFALANEDKLPTLIENMEMLVISVDTTTESVDRLTEAINNIPSEKTITITTVKKTEEESSVL